MTEQLLVNARFLSADTTGIQRVARDLLVAARRNGLAFSTIAPRPPTDDGLGVDLVVPQRLRGRAGAVVWEQLTLPRAARGRTVLSPANLAPLAGDNVVLVHDLAPLAGPQWFSRSGRLYGRLTLAAARRARRVVTVSDDVRRQLADAGIAAGRLSVVRPAIAADLRPAPAGAIAACLERHRLDQPYLLFVGWSDPRKDVATAVAASARVAEPHTLVLVGRQHPSFAPVPVPAGGNVRTLGYVDDGDLRCLMSGAAALLYPSRYEGFGLPPLEALACGTPAVVSDLPVLHESAGDAVTYAAPGDVAAWADAIRAALRGELVAGSAPAWTWDDAARQLIDVLGR